MNLGVSCHPRDETNRNSVLAPLCRLLVIYSREKLKLFFPEGGATPKDVYFPSRRRGKYESEGVGTPQGEKSSISPRSL